MSASEKLKALEVYTDEGGDSQLVDLNEQRRADALLVALPHIVAVVEAAEPTTERSAHWLCTGTVTMMDGATTPCPICSALSALEEALS